MKDETARDAQTFGELAREHQGMMLVYARTLLREEELAREVVQESLVAAWRGLERFDVTRDVAAWLRGIVRNKWRDFCRREGRRREFSEEDLEYLEGQMQGWAGRPEVFDRLEDCRGHLSGDMAAVVEMSYDEGLKSEEVAQRLGLAAATVRKRLERARAALRECLEKAN
ncbi:MAG: RNA polymerase sigma factor [Verrucomicrobiota bacterium JB023]|nr:RNA polymerase sigma factor [Verrucomicrobiota bacterium JB023]